MIFSSIGSVFGVGESALVALIKGQGDHERANRIFSLLILTMFVLGVVLTIVSELFLPSAARLMGATDELMGNCMIYARIFLIAQSAFFLQYGLQPLMITAERPKLGLLFTVAAGVSNIILEMESGCPCLWQRAACLSLRCTRWQEERRSISMPEKAERMGTVNSCDGQRIEVICQMCIRRECFEADSSEKSRVRNE